MNFELVELESLEVEAYQVKEVLKVLLHSIVFQRALGECGVRDCESDLLDIAYVQCDSQPISQQVEEYAEAFSSALQPAGQPTEVPRLARICMSFVERRTRTSFGLFRSGEKVTWERWQITLSVRSVDESAAEPGPGNAPGGSATGVAARQRQLLQLGDELRSRLEVILLTAASRKEHIPPEKGLCGEATWFEVTSDGSDSWTGLDLFKLGFGRIPRSF